MAKNEEVTLPPKAPKSLSEFDELRERVIEVEGDLVRFAKLIGEQFGEPIKSAAMEISSKRQGS